MKKALEIIGILTPIAAVLAALNGYKYLSVGLMLVFMALFFYVINEAFKNKYK